MPVFRSCPFIVRTRGGQYAYDPVTHTITRISLRLFESLLRDFEARGPSEAWASPCLPAEAQTELESERSQGRLVAQSVEIEAWPTVRACAEALAEPYAAPSLLILEITDQCNLRCSYCCYSGNVGFRRRPGRRVSDIGRLRELIDWYLENSDPTTDRTISFYGGEPFLHVDLMAKAAEYALRKRQGPGRVTFQTTTNGTLLGIGDAERLFGLGFTLGISLDGDQAKHDWARKYPGGRGSFKTVMDNLLALHEHFGRDLTHKVLLTSTIDAWTEGNDMIGWLALAREYPFIVDIPKKYGSLNTVGNAPQHYSPRPVDDDLATLLDFWRSYRDDVLDGHADAHGIYRWALEDRMSNIHKQKERLRNEECVGGMCILGRRRLMVDLENRFFPCERVDERVSIGSFPTGISKENVYALHTKWSSILTRNCNGCWAIRFCSACFASVAGQVDEDAAFRDCCRGTQAAWARYVGLYCCVLDSSEEHWSFLGNRE